MSAETPQTATVSILELNLPGGEPLRAGVLLVDPRSNRLLVRLRRDWDAVAPQEAPVLELMESDLTEKAREMGASTLLKWFGETLSNLLRIGDEHEVLAGANLDRALSRLYRQHIQSTVRPFATHLPRYSLAVAAGKFLENQEVSADGWVETPLGLRLTSEMFAAQIEGHSMEPLIPHGSLCIFRAGVTGSRQGRLVLVEALGRGANDRYTVKRYRSEKARAVEDGSDGAWAHTRIILEPLNPEFEAWALDPQESENLRVVAEFVQVLD